MKPRDIVTAFAAPLLLVAQTALPDEALKVRALRLGYSLNAESMVRAPYLGSIDVSGLLYVPDASLIERPVNVREERHRNSDPALDERHPK